MEDDLDLEPNPGSNRYQWLLTIFYITYILFEFLTIMWKIMPAHIWAAIIVFAWGLLVVVSILTVSLCRTVIPVSGDVFLFTLYNTLKFRGNDLLIF